MRALLISTYELGHQPFGLASPAAWLRRAGIDVACADLAKEKLSDTAIAAADLIGFHLPMHTATRLAAPVIRKVRSVNSGARICAYGLYAPLNDDWLRSLGVNDVLGGEFEEDLTNIAVALRSTQRPRSSQSSETNDQLRNSPHSQGHSLPDGEDPLDLDFRRIDSAVSAASALTVRRSTLPKLQFLVPDRSGLPPLSRYATLRMPDGTTRIAGHTEASRGCRHLCRHCPVVPIYEGQFRVVQPDVVLADIGAQVAQGAQHITFGDPDFFNGPAHAMRIVDALHQAHPGVTYDVTIKVEHLLERRELLVHLRETGCLFVTSAVESLDDRVLGILEKGHTRRDFLAAVALCRDAGLTLVPTFVAFHPWITLEGYCDLVDTIADLDLIDHVPPIQLAIRLLIPRASRLLELPEVRRLVGGFDGNTLTHRWAHPDPHVDALHGELSMIVGRRLMSDRRELFATISAVAHERAGLPDPRRQREPARSAAVPYLDEPWYCCAEPNPEQLTLV